ncbi:MAG: hypothetical protein IPG50_27870 [Myxococcales bacterium]|nr:hypothetical protein [Myxococcales bacterium]
MRYRSLVLLGLASLMFACVAETTSDDVDEPVATTDESELVRRSVVIDADDDGKTVAVNQHQKFTIMLTRSGSNGYSWWLKDPGAFGATQRRSAGVLDSFSWNVGSETGTHTIELAYAKSANGPPTKRFEVTLAVTSALSGKCGGLAGLRCNGDEWCNYTTSVCGRFDQMGRCEPRPERCRTQHQPVCGCNGRTYSNSCIARAAGVDVAASGPCAE